MMHDQRDTGKILVNIKFNPKLKTHNLVILNIVHPILKSSTINK